MDKTNEKHFGLRVDGDILAKVPATSVGLKGAQPMRRLFS